MKLIYHTAHACETTKPKTLTCKQYPGNKKDTGRNSANLDSRPVLWNSYITLPMPVRQPNPRQLPVSIRVWFFPQAAPTTLWSFRDSITVGKSRRFVSPTPSCPFSFRPSEVTHYLILLCLHNWKLGLENMQISRLFKYSIHMINSSTTLQWPFEHVTKID